MALGSRIVCHHGDNTYLDFSKSERNSFCTHQKFFIGNPPLQSPCKILSHPFAGRIIFFIFAESIVKCDMKGLDKVVNNMNYTLFLRKGSAL